MNQLLGYLARPIRQTTTMRFAKAMSDKPYAAGNLCLSQEIHQTVAGMLTANKYERLGNLFADLCVVHKVC